MAKNWAITQFSASDGLAVFLEINGQKYPVVATVATFAVNEIPKAQCVLALGYNGTLGVRSPIHDTADQLLAMTKAKLTMQLLGESAPDTDWPSGPITLFEGYYTGFGYQKYYGQVHLVIYLSHWLMSMTFSSTLSAISHPNNEFSTVFHSITSIFPPEQPQGEAGTAPDAGGSTPAQTIFMPEIVGLASDYLQRQASNDLWVALYQMMAAMCQYDAYMPACSAAVTFFETKAVNNIKTNNKALEALRRFEGATDVSGSGATEKQTVVTDYLFSKKLKFESALQSGIFEGMGSFLNMVGGNLANVSQLSSQNMWNFLLGGICTHFHLAICPAIDRAMIMADTPTWRGTDGTGGGYWRTIGVNEYAGIDQSGQIEMPLRGVVLYGPPFGEAYIATSGGVSNCLAGHYASDAASDADGTVIYNPLPQWIGMTAAEARSASEATGVDANTPVNTGTTPPATQPTTQPSDDARNAVQTIADSFAHSFYTQHVLRGRSGTLTGKLRFDIAPGSFVKIEGSPEHGVKAASDKLAMHLYGQVNRVTININADQGTASTSLVLTHLRNEQENKEDRTSVAANPIYGSDIYVGAPLHVVFKG